MAVCHATLLLWLAIDRSPSLTVTSFQGSIQMVEVKLGSAKSQVEVSSPPPVIKEPAPVIDSPPPESGAEVITTVKSPLPKADFILKPAPKLAQEKPKPVVHKSEKIKTAKITKVENKQAKKRDKPASYSSTAHSGEKRGIANASPNAFQEEGNPLGKAGSNSAQGNSHVNASLGAGYGQTLTGRCSELSDEADDQGSVQVLVSLAPTGQATQVDLLSSSGIKRLDNQAKRIAQAHTYSPARINGKAVEGNVRFTIHFKCGASA
ncbi:energy transducer TonB [Mannheimia granulomatis]|uniref:energy transducer TonB n=1 Tax=Mannheimia granulomatis TaxID=85402 RepID=UPI00159E82D8|nr:energy transducer TonB [Mannheimia granulomatis]